MVSDKGMKCPKCGTPIHKVEEAAKPIEEKEKVIAEVESPKVEIPKVEAVPSIDEFANGSKNSKRGIVAVVCGIVAIAIIGASYYLWKNHRTDGTESTIAMNDSISNIEMLDSAQVEEAITDEVIEDSVAFATVENVNESICEEYERLLDENRASEGDCEYFLYDIDNDDKLSQEISIAYKVGEDDSGAQFAAKYFKEAFKGSGIDVEVEPYNSSRSQYAVVITTPRGTAEEVTALLQKYIGQGNSVKLEGADKFALYNRRSVSVDVNVADFVKASGYTGVVEYGFRGAGEASSVSWNSSVTGKGKNDVLMGKSQSEFDHPISAQTFTVSYQVQRVNLIFVMLVGALAIVACGAVIMLLSGLVLRRRRKRQKEKMEAVMTMALVKLPDGTQTMMEVTPEEAANAVVIAPKDDDGLDEDDDEPENMWLFTTAMRLFAAMAGVLVVLNYAGVDSERNTLNPLEFFNSAKGVSGWDLIVGKEINNRMLEGSYFNIVLIAIPLIIFLILSLRNLLPKLLSDIVIICSSLFQAWYMLGLRDSLEEKVDLLGMDGKRFFVEMDWAYNYSVVIYVLLFVGAVILILMDTGLNFKRMLRRKDKI